MHWKKSSKKIRSTVRSFRNCQMNSLPNGNFHSSPRNSTEELAVALNLLRMAASKCGRLRLRFRGHREFPRRGEGLTFWRWHCQRAFDGRLGLPRMEERTA